MSRFRDFSKVPGGQIDWDAVKQESRALNSIEMNVRRANVPKITLVKEGQQHPVGKHGQLKLFHEHVWPKGFTPQRLADVRDSRIGYVHDYVDTPHSNRVRNIVTDAIARSTIPSDDIDSMGYYGDITLTDEVDAGEFDPEEVEIRLNPNAIADKQNTKRLQDPSNVVANQTTIHELGHMDDYLSDFDDFEKNHNRGAFYIETGGHVSPALEGRAEGYKLAHTRVTRSMERRNYNLGSPSMTYKPMGFSGVDRKVFELNRLKSFRHASGLDPYPRITETPQSEERTHPVLPGMEPYV